MKNILSILIELYIQNNILKYHVYVPYTKPVNKLQFLTVMDGKQLTENMTNSLIWNCFYNVGTLIKCK